MKVKERKRGFFEKNGCRSLRWTGGTCFLNMLLVTVNLERAIAIFKETLDDILVHHCTEEAIPELIEIWQSLNYAHAKKSADEKKIPWSDVQPLIEKNYWNFLMDVYWRLPNCPDTYDGEKTSTFLAKNDIIRRFEASWMPKSTDSNNDLIFRFLITAYESPRILPNAVLGSIRSQQPVARRTISKEREAIEEIIREKVQHGFQTSSEDLEHWLAFDDLPQEIERILRIAWARNGGPELVRTAMHNRAIVEKLSVDEATRRASELMNRDHDDPGA